MNRKLWIKNTFGSKRTTGAALRFGPLDSVPLLEVEVLDFVPNVLDCDRTGTVTARTAVSYTGH